MIKNLQNPLRVIKTQGFGMLRKPYFQHVHPCKTIEKKICNVDGSWNRCFGDLGWFWNRSGRFFGVILASKIKKKWFQYTNKKISIFATKNVDFWGGACKGTEPRVLGWMASRAKENQYFSIPGTWYLVPGTWYLEPIFWYQVSGNQKDGFFDMFCTRNRYFRILVY